MRELAEQVKLRGRASLAAERALAAGGFRPRRHLALRRFKER